MTIKTKDQMRKEIRDELVKDLKNPDFYYPISKKNRDKLKDDLYKNNESK